MYLNLLKNYHNMISIDCKFIMIEKDIILIYKNSIIITIFLT